MKIAVMVYSLDSIGGIAKHVLYQCREMVAMGHQVDIWAVEFDRERCYPALTNGLNIHALRRPRPSAIDYSRGQRMVTYLKDVWKYHQDQQQLVAAMPEGYDILNPHGNTIHWAAANYKWQYGTPIVWMCNDFWPM